MGRGWGGGGEGVKPVALDSSCRKLVLNSPIPLCRSPPTPMMTMKSPTQLVRPAPWALDEVMFWVILSLWLY